MISGRQLQNRLRSAVHRHRLGCRGGAVTAAGGQYCADQREYRRTGSGPAPGGGCYPINAQHFKSPL
jgi:hypothetical protein